MSTKLFILTPFSSAVLRRGVLALCLPLCILGAALPATATASEIQTFDVPGAGTGPYQGTTGVQINWAGTIAGNFIDGNNVQHGFLRDPYGNLTTFDVPGGVYLTVRSVNASGEVVGGFFDKQSKIHAFLRHRDGSFTTFDAPGACKMSTNKGCNGTGAWNINDVGEIIGPYEDTSGNFVAHTFIRYPNGSFTTFAVPGSSQMAGQGTLPASSSGLTQWNAITGIYYDANNVFHGYLRYPDGTFVKFEAPGADTLDAFAGTTPGSINNLGATAGYYAAANGVYHAFLRSLDGSISDFDAPGADLTPGDFNGTFPSQINDFGVIAGNYTDINGANHGFIRSASGKFTTFDVPGAGAGAFQGTVPYSNNIRNAITGNYVDANNVSHGFLRLP